MNNRVSVIIVHWNTPALLRKQLKELSQSEKFHIVVVDNNSDESVEWIKQDYARVTLIQNKHNRGYAAACNQGALAALGPALRIRRIGGEVGWFLFLNPDVQITAVEIEKMAQFAQLNNLTACSPLSSHGDYAKPLPSTVSLLAEFTSLRRIIPLSAFPTKTLFGGCVLIRSHVLKKLGGWDERFFLWFEDSDLTKRLVNQGYTFGWFPHRVKHGGGVAFKKLNKQQQKDLFFHSMRIFANKHFSRSSQFIVSLITKRFSNRQALPGINGNISITVPNIDKSILEDFFRKNKNKLSKVSDLIVVSSALKDDVWTWRKKYPHVRFIPIEKNEGVAATINVGLRVSTGEYVGTVNDDVELSDDWIEKCLDCKTEMTGSLNPVIYKKSGGVESAGVEVLKRGRAVPITTFDQTQRCFETDASNGAAILYLNEALSRVGFFDERFGSYLEDVDLSLRLKRARFKNIVATGSRVVHIGQASSQRFGAKKALYDFRNWFYVIAKNWNVRDLVVHTPSIAFERLRNLSGVIKAFVKR